MKSLLKILSNVSIILMIAYVYSSCDDQPEDILPDSYTYDPQAAGAEILSAYNLTNFFTGDFAIRMAEYNNRYYLAEGQTIIVLETGSMAFNAEISVDLATVLGISTLDPAYSYCRVHLGHHLYGMH